MNGQPKTAQKVCRSCGAPLFHNSACDQYQHQETWRDRDHFPSWDYNDDEDSNMAVARLRSMGVAERSQPRRRWAIAVRLLAVPIWYPFSLLAWVGEKSDAAFWWIEGKLPSPYRRAG